MNWCPSSLSRRARQRLGRAVARVKRAFATAPTVAILLLSACSSNPPIISGDTSCERFRHISFNDEQIKAVAADWKLWESVADQVVQHNVEYDAHCLRGGE